MILVMEDGRVGIVGLWCAERHAPRSGRPRKVEVKVARRFALPDGPSYRGPWLKANGDDRKAMLLLLSVQ